MSGDTLVLYVNSNYQDNVHVDFYVLKDFNTGYIHIYGMNNGSSSFSFKSDKKFAVCNFIRLLTEESFVNMDLLVFPNLPKYIENINYNVLCEHHDDITEELYSYTRLNDPSKERIMRFLNIIANIGNDVTEA